MALLDEGMAAWQARGFAHLAPFLLALQAEACLKTRRLKEGTAAVSAARATAPSGGDRYWVAELDRLRGELLTAQGRNDGEAEACFRRAMETTRRQGARMLELRAATSLARLWRDQGRREEAHQVLSEVYAQFDEGFDTEDLQAAGSLLEALS